MGLDTSHDAFHGAYSAFNRLRQIVARAMGGSYPPHFQYASNGNVLKDENEMPLYLDTDVDEYHWYSGEKYSQETHPGLWEFLCHSDCDGEIKPEMCLKIAKELTALLPKIKEVGWDACGHIAARGGYVEVVQKFIDGCIDAWNNGECLDFH